MKRHRKRRLTPRLYRPCWSEPLERRLLLARTIYVDLSAPGPAHDGTSWNTAYADLQQGLAAAVSGDQIHVAQGMYKPTSTTKLTISFDLKDGVQLLGGYAGSSSANPDDRNWAAYSTILSGNIGNPSSPFDNSYHVVTISSASSATLIEGFAITGGYAFSGGIGDQNFGGGIFVKGGSPLIRNCRFYANLAKEGGAICNSSSSPTIANCVFSDDQGGSGLAIGNLASSAPFIVDCTISEGLESAIFDSNSSPTIQNCIVWSTLGPAFEHSGGVLTVTYSDIRGGAMGTGNIASDPLFLRNPGPGPDGGLGTADDDFGDLRLHYNSLAIDAGRNSDADPSNGTDLAGINRFQDIPSKADTGVGTAPIVDMGAYEATWSTILYVDPKAPGSEIGTSWATAYRDLVTALSIAISGQEIHVAAGTYTPTSSLDRNATFQLNNGVSLIGGYAGNSAADPDARDVALYPAILSGDIGVLGNYSDNSYHVVTRVGTSTTATLDGFIITGGNANPTTGIGGGGGMYNNTGAQIIRNCTFLENRATVGGAVYQTKGNLTLSNCVFIRNSASIDSGGAVNCPSSGGSPQLTVANCTFLGNTAPKGGAINAGGYGSALTNCLFDGNSATGLGGAVYMSSAPSSSIVNCSFVANAAAQGGATGNGAQIANSIFWENTAATYPQIYGTNSAVTFSDIDGGYSGLDNIAADPLFVRTPSPGPDGKWGTADDDYGDLHLRPGSPAINTGSNAAVPAGIATDVDGYPRILDGTVDMGAYELQRLTPARGDVLSIPAGSFRLESTAILSSLSLTNTASLDLLSHDLIVTYSDSSPESQVQEYVQNWLTNSTGPKLLASSASDSSSQFPRTLAVADNANVQFPGFSGVAFAAGNFNQILVKYTYFGDANLDGQVTPTDYAIVDGNIGLNHDWGKGDLNGDGNTTPADYALIDGNIGAGTGGDGGPQLTAILVVSDAPRSSPAALPGASSQPPAAISSPFSSRLIRSANNLLKLDDPDLGLLSPLASLLA